MTQDTYEAAGQAPPNDLPAEMALLGALMTSAQAIADVTEIVQPGDFYQPKNDTVYAAILDLFANGEPVDPVTVAARLEASGDLARIGGLPYLHSLFSAVGVAANASYYAAIVRDKAILRKTAEAAVRIVQMAHGADARDARDAAVAAVLDRAQGELLAVAARRSAGETRDVGAIILDAVTEMETIGKSGGVSGLSTGFADLDGILHGFHPGQLIIIAGRPGLGKSTMALDMLRACAVRAGQPAAMFSLEMGRNELATKVLSAESRVMLHHMRGGTMSDQDWTRVGNHIAPISAAPLFIDDTPGTTPVEIRSKCRRLKAEHGLALVVVDYLQLMTSGRHAENRQQEVSEMSRSLKLIAKELEVPLIAVSQLNRGPEQRTDKKPLLSDLRESGAIEQDADVVLLLHREDYYDRESPRAGEADIIVAKQRNGPTGTVAVASQLHYSRFIDLTDAIAPTSPWT